MYCNKKSKRNRGYRERRYNQMESSMRELGLPRLCSQARNKQRTGNKYDIQLFWNATHLLHRGCQACGSNCRARRAGDGTRHDCCVAKKL